MSPLGRATAVLATLAIASTLWLTIDPGNASADDNALILPSDMARVTLGPNVVLRVDGRLRSFNNCTAPGIADFVYPASDIYIVPAAFDPSTGSTLTDVTGSPGTIVQGGSAFVSEIIAITAPGGTLEPGRYSVVFDTCQDGRFQTGTDEIFRDVIDVVFPPVIPAAAPWIAELKSNSHTAWGNWQQIGKLFDTLLNVDKAAGCSHGTIKDCIGVLQIWVDSPSIQAWLSGLGVLVNDDAVKCASGVMSGCFGVVSKYWSPDTSPIRTFVTSGVKNLIANQAKAHFGVYADPPRDDFTTPSSAQFSGEGGYPVPVLNGDGPVFDTLSQFASALERELLLREALLAALERYQGAQAAGDPVAALAQARTATGLATSLADAGLDTAGRLEELIDAIDLVLPDLDTISQDSRDRLSMISGGGFDPAEDRFLRNAGVSGSERVAYLGELATLLGTTTPRPAEGLRQAVGELVASQSTMTATLDTLSTDLATLADTITGVDPAHVPTIELPPHHDASVDVPLQLTATTSADVTVTWDLDADGQFDNGTGSSESATFASAGHRVVAAMATNGAGVSVVAHTLVDVTSTNAPPTIVSTIPDPTVLATGTVGYESTFSLSVSDSDHDSGDLSYQWFVDGVAVPGATGPTLAITPNSAERGAHTVDVVVRDPEPGNLAQQAWRWQVSDVDADGDGWAANEFADCDDSNADINPNQFEQLFNGIDDDCNPATPDAPLELDVGQLWGWGTADGANGTGSGVASATPRYQGVDHVSQAVAAWIAGAILDDQGFVWAWGSGAMAGDGDPNHHVVTTPRPVVPPGWSGGPGQLGGVIQLTSSANWFGALTADGRVLTWGNRGNSAIGQGNPTQSAFPVPGYVVDEAGAPIDDVVAIEGGSGSGYAILADGTAEVWGYRMCVTTGLVSFDHAVAAPHLGRAGTTIAQIEGGNRSLLVRYADGTVGWCGDISLPVQQLELSTFAGQRAVDLATVGNGAGAFVLTEDGSVWVTGTPSAFQIAPVQTEAPVTSTGWVRAIMPAGARIVALDGQDAPCAIFAIREDGTSFSWGDINRDCDGQGADRVTVTGHATPGQLAIPGKVRDISGGGYNTVAVVGRTGGDVWTWGAPTAALGRSGDERPAPIPGLTNVIEVVSNQHVQYALTATGDVVGWGGSPFKGFDGNGPSPVYRVGAAIGRLGGVTALVGGETAMAALLSNGRVVSWGFQSGTSALGSGTADIGRNYPDFVLDDQLQPIEGITRLFGGNDGGVAVRSDGTVLQWGGRHCAGVPLSSSYSNIAVPAVGWPSDIAQYSGADHGFENALVRRADGTVMSCGEPSGESVLRPVPAIGPDDPAIDVAAGPNHAWIVTANGDLWAWITLDTNATNALGIAPMTWSRVALPAGARPVDVEADWGAVHVRLADGAVLTFGEDTNGKLGRSGDAWQLLPAEIGGFVLDTSGKTWNGAAVVLGDALLQRSAWVPPQAGVSVSVEGGSGSEGGTTTAGITLSGAAATDLVVTWEFDGEGGSVVVPAGATSAPVTLDLPAPDGIWGVDRTSSFIATGVDGGATLAGEVAEVIVLDADPAPVLSIMPTSLDEGDGALTGHMVTVGLSGPAGIDVPVRLTSADGTANAGTDFQELDIDLVVRAGVTTTSAPLLLFGNHAAQPDRAFALTATSELLAPVETSITIVDDDPVSLIARADRVMSGEPAAVELVVPLLPTGEQVVVEWQTADGDATAPSDYMAGSGTVTITGGPDDVGTATVWVPTVAVAPPPRIAASGFAFAVAGDEPEVRSFIVDLSTTSARREVLGPDRVAVGIARLTESELPPSSTSSTSSTVTPSPTAPATSAATVPTTRPAAPTPTASPSAGVPTTASAAVPPTVEPPGTPVQELPATGGDVGGMLALAALTVLIGLAAHRVRRHSSQH